jgi:hypothetical protein
MHCAKIPEMWDRDIAANEHPLTNRQWVNRRSSGFRKAGGEPASAQDVRAALARF